MTRKENEKTLESNTKPDYLRKQKIQSELIIRIGTVADLESQPLDNTE